MCDIKRIEQISPEYAKIRADLASDSRIEVNEIEDCTAYKLMYTREISDYEQENIYKLKQKQIFMCQYQTGQVYEQGKRYQKTNNYHGFYAYENLEDVKKLLTAGTVIVKVKLENIMAKGIVLKYLCGVGYREIIVIMGEYQTIEGVIE